MRKKTSPIFQLFIAAVIICSSLNLSAQCLHTLQMFDSFGDGWNGAELTVTINGVATTYTVGFNDNNGDFLFVDLIVNDGDVLTLDYSPGTFENEVTYNILDSSGNIVFEDGPGPMTGTGVFTTTLLCPSCPAPLDSVNFVDVKANFALIEFFTLGNVSTIVEYGPAGFAPGAGTTTINTMNSEATLFGLTENTDYEIYLSIDCGVDTSAVLGPYPFTTIFLNDVGIVGVLQPNTSSCGTADSLEVVIQNFGQNPQSLVPIQFSINGVPADVNVPVDGFFTGVVSFDSTATFVFDMTQDFSVPGSSFTVQAWTEFEPDNNIQNDTFTIEIAGVNAFPLIEDFEGFDFGEEPPGWTVDDDINFTVAHLSETAVMWDNIWSFDPIMVAATPNYAFVSEGDELNFDYRLVDFSAGDVGTDIGGNTVAIDVTLDCGVTYSPLLLIDQSNHITSADFTTITLDLTQFAGEAIGFRFTGTWAEGDYFLDIDNVNIIACPASLSLATDTTDPTATGNNGTASVTPSLGVPPYTYDWSNGASTSMITGLGDGVFTVIVTDSIGCVDQAEVIIGSGVSTYEIETLESVNIFPNPTFGQATLQVGFNESTDMTIQIIDIYGKVISEEFHGGVIEKHISLEADRFEAGMYFVRIETNGKWHMEKLLKL